MVHLLCFSTLKAKTHQLVATDQTGEGNEQRKEVNHVKPVVDLQRSSPAQRKDQIQMSHPQTKQTAATNILKKVSQLILMYCNFCCCHSSTCTIVILCDPVWENWSYCLLRNAGFKYSTCCRSPMIEATYMY